jgi:hypothetical protein
MNGSSRGLRVRTRNTPWCPSGVEARQPKSFLVVPQIILQPLELSLVHRVLWPSLRTYKGEV